MQNIRLCSWMLFLLSMNHIRGIKTKNANLEQSSFYNTNLLDKYEHFVKEKKNSILKLSYS